MDEAIAGVSGGISGLLATLVWYPLENVRIRLQQKYLEEKKRKSLSLVSDDNLSQVELVSSLNINEEDSLLKQTIYLLKKIKREEGINSLYNGISSALIGSAQSYGVYFYAYQYWKNFFEKHGLNKNIIYDSLCTSFLGAACCAIITNPIWVLNTRIIQAKDKCKNMSNMQMIKKMIKEEGIFCFFNGIIPSLIMTINPVIQYMIYEFLRVKFANIDGTIASANIIWISILSKLVTTLITYPMLTIKTLFQSNDKKSTYELISIIQNIVKKKGIKGLFEGISAKLAQTLINNTITMVAFEKIQQLLRILLVIYINYKIKDFKK